MKKLLARRDSEIKALGMRLHEALEGESRAEDHCRDLLREVERLRVVVRSELDAIAGVLGASRMDGARGWHYEAVSQLLRERDHYASACVAAMRGQDPPWLDELTSALGWQGGTAVEAIHAVKRLVGAAKEQADLRKAEEE